MQFAHKAFDRDPELNQVTGDIVLWSGLSFEEQMDFKPSKLSKKKGNIPMLLARTWVSQLMAQLTTFEWGDDKENKKIKEICEAKKSGLKSNSNPGDDDKPYCLDPCGWHPDMTIKPWEAVSRAIVLFHEAKLDSGNAWYRLRKDEIYVLLNKWSKSSVFAVTELKTF